METPTVVNSANVCMTLLGLWFVDYIIFFLEAVQGNLLKFINFYDTFAQKNKFRPNIKFTSSFFKACVELLDTSAKFSRSCLMTKQFCKTISSGIHLHRCSDHPYHPIKPKCQFLRTRRIWTEIKNDWKHVNRFIRHYVKRGCQTSRLKQISNEITKKEGCHDLTPDLNTKIYSQNSGRNPSATDWQWNFVGVSKILQDTYEHITRKYPHLKKIFPNSTISAF